MWPHMWDGGTGWWGMMLFGMLLFWTAVFVGLYLLYRVLMQPGVLRPAGGPPMETPRAILDRRLAAGEITPEDYDRLRQKLEG